MVAIFTIGLAATRAQAGTVLLYDISADAGGFSSASVGNVGFDFTIATAISIGSLGLWDDGGNGLAGPHQVGVFNLAGVLQVSATVDNTSMVVASENTAGRWLFTSLANPFALAAGSYTLGYFDPSAGNDPFRYDATGVFMPGSSWVTSRFDAAPSFGRPTGQGDRTQGYFGPNLMTAVPLPPAAESGLALLACLGGLAWMRRRQKPLRA